MILERTGVGTIWLTRPIQSGGGLHGPINTNIILNLAWQVIFHDKFFRLSLSSIDAISAN